MSISNFIWSSGVHINDNHDTSIIAIKFLDVMENNWKEVKKYLESKNETIIGQLICYLISSSGGIMIIEYLFTNNNSMLYLSENGVDIHEGDKITLDITDILHSHLEQFMIDHNGRITDDGKYCVCDCMDNAKYRLKLYVQMCKIHKTLKIFNE